jgi:hypothetical protein
MPSHIATVTTEHGEELWGKQKIEPEVINPHDIRNTRLINSFTTKVDTIKRNGLYFALVSRKGGCFFRIYWPEKKRELRSSEMPVSLCQLQWRDTHDYLNFQGLNLRKP